MATTQKEASQERLAEALRKTRSALGATQAEFASALDISLRALQSYEQGWRDVPVRTVKQGLVLLALRQEKDGKRKPCWSMRNCPPEARKECPGRTLGNGRLCWFVMQEPHQSCEPGHPFPCLDCPVVLCLLRGTDG